MKILVCAATAAASIALSGVSGASAAPATDAVARAAGRLAPAQLVRLERRHEAPRHRRHSALTMQATTAPAKPEVGRIYQDGSYTYRIGADGRRWYEPTICNCGPQ